MYSTEYGNANGFLFLRIRIMQSWFASPPESTAEAQQQLDMENPRSNEVLCHPQATLPPVDDWYARRDVLVTGASGFLGSILVEKLLSSCPHIGTIFVLLRPKKGQQPQDRIHKLTGATLFDGLRRSNPEALKKLRVVSGDVAEQGLNLSAEDATVLEERVSVVFHVAATVRFDEPFNKYILLNTRGTREVCELAKRMTKLQCFVHVSTAYSNSNRPMVDEQMYPPPGDWKHYVHLAENSDDYVMDVLSKKILGNFGNTYVFSKCLAENVLLDYQQDLPIVVLRPSIICSTAWDPFPGWTNNVFGPAMYGLAAMKGIVHVMAVDDSVTADIIPADIVVNGLIVCSVKKSVLDKPNDIVVYNASSHGVVTTSFKAYPSSNRRLMAEQASKVYNKSMCIAVQNMRLAKFLIVLFDFVYLSFLDILLRLMGQKQSILRILRLTVVAMIITYYFGTRDFVLRNEKFTGLNKYIHPKDKENVTFDLKHVCMNNVNRHMFYTYRKYFFKETKFNHKITSFWFDVIAAVAAIIFVYFLWNIGVHTFAFGLIERAAKFAFML